MKLISLLSILLLASFVLLCLSPIGMSWAGKGPEKKGIINGERAKPGDFPYIMLVRTRSELICSAFLITTKTALSAAHCFVRPFDNGKLPSYWFYGVLGTIEVRAEEDKYYFDKITTHNDFKYGVGFHDVATIILKKKVRLNKLIKTIPLGDESLIGSYAMFAVGWGRHDFPDNLDYRYLKYITIKSEDPGVCSRKLKEEFDSDKLICMAQHNDSCAYIGDSGSPLVVRRPEGDVGVGILTILTEENTCEDSQVVYVPISPYKDWIVEHTVGDISFAKV